MKALAYFCNKWVDFFFLIIQSPQICCARTFDLCDPEGPARIRLLSEASVAPFEGLISFACLRAGWQTASVLLRGFSEGYLLHEVSGVNDSVCSFPQCFGGICPSSAAVVRKVLAAAGGSEGSDAVSETENPGLRPASVGPGVGHPCPLSSFAARRTRSMDSWSKSGQVWVVSELLLLSELGVEGGFLEGGSAGRMPASPPASSPSHTAPCCGQPSSLLTLLGPCPRGQLGAGG